MSKLQQFLHQPIKHQSHHLPSHQLSKINQRIRSLLDTNRLQHDDKLSQYLRVKNKQAKIKRTKQLRKHHLMTIYDEDVKLKQKQKKMSLESLKVCANGGEWRERMKKEKGVGLLRQFEEEFTKGKMDVKYEEMLEEYILGYEGGIEGEGEREKFIKKATRDIKQKLFNYYLQQKKSILPSTHHHPHLHKLSSPDPLKHLTLQTNNQLISIQTTKTRSKLVKGHYRVRSQDQIGKQLSQYKQINAMPYILKSPSKFNKVQSQSIYQVYLNEMGEIDRAKRVMEKRRRMKEHGFLMKLRGYEMVGDYKK